MLNESGLFVCSTSVRNSFVTRLWLNRIGELLIEYYKIFIFLFIFSWLLLWGGYEISLTHLMIVYLFLSIITISDFHKCFKNSISSVIHITCTSIVMDDWIILRYQFNIDLTIDIPKLKVPRLAICLIILY